MPKWGLIVQLPGNMRSGVEPGQIGAGGYARPVPVVPTLHDVRGRSQRSRIVRPEAPQGPSRRRASDLGEPWLPARCLAAWGGRKLGPRAGASHCQNEERDEMNEYSVHVSSRLDVRCSGPQHFQRTNVDASASLALACDGIA